jgi:hypothetical protein
MAKLAIFILVVVLVQVSNNVGTSNQLEFSFLLNRIPLSHPRKFLQTYANMNVIQEIISLVYKRVKMQTSNRNSCFQYMTFSLFICSSYCCPPLRLERGKKERKVDAAITEVVTATITEATMEAATALATTEAATTEAVTAITEVAITVAATVITEVAITEVTADMDIGSLENKTCLHDFYATVEDIKHLTNRR